MYDMKCFKENAKKEPLRMGMYSAYSLDGHLIVMWYACSPYVSVRVDGEVIATRALARNGIKLALKHLNKITAATD